MLQRRFSLFGGGDSRLVDNNNNSSKGGGEELLPPTLKLETDRQVYRPGDPVIVTIQISNPSNGYSFLMERLSFEIKGIEKLDTQWFVTQKPLPGSKQRRGWLWLPTTIVTCIALDDALRVLVIWVVVVVVEIYIFISGEHVFLDSSTPILVANQIVNAGASKSCKPSSTLKGFCFFFFFDPLTVS